VVPPGPTVPPCTAGLFECNPWLPLVLAGLVIAALIGGGAAFFVPLYRRRSRVWITAQVDGGENRALGWGPELGIKLVDEGAAWYAVPLPAEGAAVRVRFERENRFVVTTGTRVARVHQGDPTPIRDDAGAIHQVILRRYRDRPNDRTAASLAPGAADSSAVEARLPDGAGSAGNGSQSRSESV
jgi:hypothetical protein